MTTNALYNEIEPYAAQWLRNLAAAGDIADGIVDERSIADLGRSDVEHHRQVHFFAGIGGWSLGLRLAGWTDDVPVWTGSCPCQPFSSASRGRGGGFDSPKHLWPEWRRLIEECRPAVILGEQVATGDGPTWYGQVVDDLEALGYSVGAVNLCASVLGFAPRQRLFFVAHTDGKGECARALDGKVARVQRAA
jgi:DNA (cytosine-5)-methyltransferase 1